MSLALLAQIEIRASRVGTLVAGSIDSPVAACSGGTISPQYFEGHIGE